MLNVISNWAAYGGPRALRLRLPTQSIQLYKRSSRRSGWNYRAHCNIIFIYAIALTECPHYQAYNVVSVVLFPIWIGGGLVWGLNIYINFKMRMGHNVTILAIARSSWVGTRTWGLCFNYYTPGIAYAMGRSISPTML